MNTYDKIKLPILPEWSRMDNLGGLVPSEIRQALMDYARAGIEADRKCRAVPLTDERIRLIWEETRARMGIGGDPVLWFARAIERAHGISAPQPAEPVRALVEDQEPLGEDFQQVLDDNRWDLYVKDSETVKVPSESDIPTEPVKRKRRYAQGTALGELGVIPMCDQVDDEPVKVPRPHEFNTGNEKLDTLLDDTYYLAEDGGMDNAIKWHESLQEFLTILEPVKVPSDLLHALRDLVAIWRKQQDEYPAEGKQAAAAVRLCANELELLLSRYGSGQPAANPEHQQLREFYGVQTDDELIDAQQQHIEKMQAKLAGAPSMALNRVREG